MFTELSGIADEIGLEYDGNASVSGYKRGFGTVVTDDDEHGAYRVEMFCRLEGEGVTADKDRITAMMSALGEGLPKNTVRSISCGWGFVTAELDKYCLLQENVIYLIEFLDKLAEGLESLGVEGTEYRMLAGEKPAGPEKLPEGAVRVKLRFDLRSILGVLGAVIGAAAMIVISVLTANADFEINTLELRFEVSTYILSGITAAVIFADYRFIARKLDACGIIVCPVLTVAAVILSGLGSGVRVCAKFAGVPFIQALRSFPEYLSEYENAGSFVFGYITRGIVLAVVACILICIFYFNRHPEETERSERVVSPGDSAFGRHTKGH